MKAEGDTRSILARYYEDDEDRSAGRRELTEHRGRTRGSEPIMRTVTLSDGGGNPVSCIRTGSSLSIQVDLDVKGTVIQPVMNVGIKTDLGTPLFGVNSRNTSVDDVGRVQGTATFSCQFDDLPLMPGTYLVDLAFGNERRDLDVVYSAIAFDVVPGDMFGTGDLPPKAAGPIFWPATWDLKAGSQPHETP